MSEGGGAEVRVRLHRVAARRVALIRGEPFEFRRLRVVYAKLEEAVRHATVTGARGAAEVIAWR